MSSAIWFSGAAAAIFFGLAVLSAARGTRPLVLLMAALSVVLFAYNALEAVGDYLDTTSYEWLEAAAAAIAAPLLLHFCFAFMGVARTRRQVLLATYLYFGLLSASCALSVFGGSELATWPSGRGWSLAMLTGLAAMIPTIAVGLLRHYRSNPDERERSRTQLLALALILGVLGPATDLLAIAGVVGTPRLSAVGLMLSGLALAALALRFRTLEGSLALTVGNLVLVAALGVGAHLVIFRWLGSDTTVLVAASTGVTLLILGIARAVYSLIARARERDLFLSGLARFSAQMTHDIKNPLAAIRGAAQYLEHEIGSTGESGEFVQLIIEQTDRLESIVREYQRLGRAEARFRSCDVSALLERVARGLRGAEAVDVKVVAREPLSVRLDPDLVEAALENLVRNATQAIESGSGSGAIVISAEKRGSVLVLGVQDDGPGMDPRTLELATQTYFTTKREGTGLGLAFARQVANVHDGRLELTSGLGKGTHVRLRIPWRESEC